MKVERTLGEPRVSSFKKCIFKFTKKAVTKGYDQLVKNLRTPFDPKSYFGSEEQKKNNLHFIFMQILLHAKIRLENWPVLDGRRLHRN